VPARSGVNCVWGSEVAESVVPEVAGTEASAHTYVSVWSRPQPLLKFGEAVMNCSGSLSASLFGDASALTVGPTGDGDAGVNVTSGKGAFRPQRPPMWTVGAVRSLWLG